MTGPGAVLCSASDFVGKVTVWETLLETANGIREKNSFRGTLTAENIYQVFYGKILFKHTYRFYVKPDKSPCSLCPPIFMPMNRIDDFEIERENSKSKCGKV